MLWPRDHVDGADPEVVDLFREARLPVLRWPGGNFVSGYHWQDGVGPMDSRPTRPNLAWGGIEPNLFGTDEFVSFCRAVGCEPMICVNAGDGTPEEAAAWVEYCNGSVETSMGKLRAGKGQPEPYGIRFWEIGNELWGKWQIHWTTPAGYLDRYRRFCSAMREVDSGIEIFACGAPVFSGDEWNRPLIEEPVERTTDHVLMGSTLPSHTDPMDVYRDFMLYPDAFARRYEDLRRSMEQAGATTPRLAITELQLFARLEQPKRNTHTSRLDRGNLVSPATLAEALYDTLFYQMAVRTGPFLDMITHSATVNHGGGLRKLEERVFTNPCYYAQKLFAEFAGAVPLKVEVACPAVEAALVLPDLKATGWDRKGAVLVPLAALAGEQNILLSLVNRGQQALKTKVVLEGIAPEGPVDVQLLTAEAPWAANSLEHPEAVVPLAQAAAFADGTLTLDIPSFSLAHVRISLTRR
jgi:alpha-N-arabinofuranosidase